MTDAPLHPSLAPLAWLLGSWEGVGVGDYPTIEAFRFGQRVEVTSTGTPVLQWSAQAWILDDEGALVRPAASERGYWRMPEGADPPVELLLAHGTGHVEIWYGEVTEQRVELATDLVAGTATAKQVSAGKRLIGLVEGDLMWAYDMAAVGQPLQPHLSARLRKLG
jgi:hypothetical protein